MYPQGVSQYTMTQKQEGMIFPFLLLIFIPDGICHTVHTPAAEVPPQSR